MIDDQSQSELFLKKHWVIEKVIFPPDMKNSFPIFTTSLMSCKKLLILVAGGTVVLFRT